MIEREQIVDWLDHPVTQLYLSRLTETIQRENSLDIIDVSDAATTEQVGAKFIGHVNFVSGLNYASDLSGILEVSNDD